MVKTKDEQLKDNEKFWGGRGKEISWTETDGKVTSYVRKAFGEKYGKLLWRNELLSLIRLEVGDETSVDYYTFIEHCQLVYDVIGSSDNRYAENLYDGTRFWIVPWQLGQRARFREQLYCYLETIMAGEAERQLRSVGVAGVAGIRNHMFNRFGGGHTVELRLRQAQYCLGLPKSLDRARVP